MAEDKVDTSRYHIKPLSAENYFMWSNKMEIVLRGKGLWEIVTGEEVAPGAQDLDGVKKFTRRRDVTVTNLLLTIEDSCSANVINMRDPKTIWDTLKATFQSMSKASTDAYLAQYRNIKMAGDEKIMSYVNRLQVLENKLAEVGHSLDRDEKRRTLLRGLREEFAVTSEVIRATDKDYNEAIGQLVVFEDLSHEEAEVEQSAKALTTQKRDTTCSHCGRQGHEKINCYHNPQSKNYRKGGRFPFNRGNRSKKGGNNGTNKKDDKGGKNPVYTTFLASNDCLESMTQTGNLSFHKKWFVDLGASSHMCNNRELFQTLRERTSGPTVSVGNGKHAIVTGVGTLLCSTVVDGKRQEIELRNVLHVPSLICNLVSVSKMRRAGLRVIFDSNSDDEGICTVTNKNSGCKVLTALELDSNGLYDALLVPSGNQKSLLSTTEKSILWHERLGHLRTSMFKQTIPIVDGIGLETVELPSICESCEKVKSKRSPRPSSGRESKLSTEPLDLFHTDIVGPIKASLGGAVYFVPLYDDSSGLSLVRFTTNKSKASSAVKEMITELETARNSKVKRLYVKRLRSDNDSVFLSNNFQKWMKEKGIIHERTATYSPESNGKAERLNRTLMDMARAMLMDLEEVDLRRKLWAEAVSTANFLRNRCFTSAANDSQKTPYEIIMGKRPHLGHIRKFGAVAFVHKPKVKRRGKFDERAIKGILVGYERGNSYRVYIPEDGKVIVSRDVTFQEQQSKTSSVEVDIFPDNSSDGSNSQDQSDDRDSLDGSGFPDLLEDDNNDEDGRYQHPDTPRPELTHYPGVRRSSRVSIPPERFVSTLALQARLSDIGTSIPLTYDEAINGTENEEWRQAMREEMDSIERKGTWKLVPLPANARPIKNKWVFDKKFDANGFLKRNRARLVAKGFSQRQGIDFDEVFSPVAKYSTLRLLLALVTDEELNLLQLDVKSAFLNGELEETIYMEQPQGFVIKDKAKFVYRLLKALYGLKQASRAWHKKVDTFLKSIGFKTGNADKSLYFLVVEGEYIFVLVYVDDILLAARHMELLEEIAGKIGAQFEIRVEMEVSKFLGIIIERDQDNGTVKLHNAPMIDEVLNRFAMKDCRKVSTPLPKGLILDLTMAPKTVEERSEMSFKPYRELVGVLLHLANTVRPDIAFAVGLLSRFMHDPGLAHWKAAKHVIRYLGHTKTMGIEYKRSVENDQGLFGYSDSDFAGDRDKSTSGHVFIFAGGAISWRSKCQTVTAQSSVEAEYISMSYAVRELIWLRRLLSDLRQSRPSQPTILFGDNQGAIAMAKNGVANERTKHIEVKYNFINEYIEKNMVTLQYLSTEKMTADIMNKVLGQKKHNYCVESMGMNI